MVVLLSFAAILGAAITALTLSPFGWGIALLSAPFGGSAIVLVALLSLAVRGAPRTGGSPEPGRKRPATVPVG